MIPFQVNLRDPNTVESRIYVGHLNEGITQDLLDLKFSAYGRIVGFLRTSPGFCFIQYDQVSSAKNAIINEHGKMIGSQCLLVKAAEIKGKKPPMRFPDLDDQSIDSNEPMNKKYFNEQNEYYGNNSILALDPNDESGDVNHVEIITVSQDQNGYAEWIETRLKAVGFRVDLLFPNEDVALNKVLGSIKVSGVRYAILVTAEHEHNNSMTIYCLHGDATEHRNMPTDDALKFIYKDFMVKSKNLKSAFYKHPDSIQTMLKTLVDNRSLTVIQYDYLIQYLNQRKEVQKKVEIGQDPTDTTDMMDFSEFTAKKEQEEQKSVNSAIQNKKIQDILTNTWTEVSSPTIDKKDLRKQLLNDETIINALHILIEEFA